GIVSTTNSPTGFPCLSESDRRATLRSGGDVDSSSRACAVRDRAVFAGDRQNRSLGQVEQSWAPSRAHLPGNLLRSRAWLRRTIRGDETHVLPVLSRQR